MQLASAQCGNTYWGAHTGAHLALSGRKYSMESLSVVWPRWLGRSVDVEARQFLGVGAAA